MIWTIVGIYLAMVFRTLHGDRKTSFYDPDHCPKCDDNYFSLDHVPCYNEEVDL